jgi:hypothetical protein
LFFVAPMLQPESRARVNIICCSKPNMLRPGCFSGEPWETSDRRERAGCATSGAATSCNMLRAGASPARAQALVSAAHDRPERNWMHVARQCWAMPAYALAVRSRSILNTAAALVSCLCQPCQRRSVEHQALGVASSPGQPGAVAQACYRREQPHARVA